MEAASVTLSRSREVPHPPGRDERAGDFDDAAEGPDDGDEEEGEAGVKEVGEEGGGVGEDGEVEDREG